MGNWPTKVVRTVVNEFLVTKKTIHNTFKIGAIFLVWSLTACVAKQDLILPNKHQRVSAVNSYKQCVANATNKRMHQNRDAEAIVRESMARCRTSKYAMLKDYPKGWRDSYERQIDEEVLREEVAYVLKARNQR